MKYSLEEQETMIRYDVLAKDYILYSNYAPDIRRYLKLEEDGGLLVTLRETDEEGRVIAIEGVLQDTYRISRKPTKKRVMSEEEREVLRERFAKARKG